MTDQHATTVLEVKNLRVRNVTDDIELVRGIDLALQQGGVLGIVGESGSGKSITLRAVLGLLPESLAVSDGTIELLGRDTARFGAKDWQSVRGEGIAAIFQDPGSYLNPSLPVGRQLTEVLRVRRGLDRRAAKAEAIRLFDLVHLRLPDVVFAQYPHELSGGMLQRVLLAIALSLEPKILIADEATTALDVTVQAEVLELLDDLRERLGLSLIIVSHDLAVVAQLADEVLVFRDGEVVERGTTRDVLFSPAHDYTRLLIEEHELYGLDRYLESEVRGV